MVSKSERLSGKAVFASLPYPGLMISLFVTTMVIQLCNGSVGPILALFIKSMEPRQQQYCVSQRDDCCRAGRIGVNLCAAAGKTGRQDRLRRVS